VREHDYEGYETARKVPALLFHPTLERVIMEANHDRATRCRTFIEAALWTAYCGGDEIEMHGRRPEEGARDRGRVGSNYFGTSSGWQDLGFFHANVDHLQDFPL
jgi:hypothetical protein